MLRSLSVVGLLCAGAVFSLTTDHWPLTTARAAKVKVWQQHTPGHFEKAQFNQAVVSSEGALRLARRLKPLADIHAAHVWDVVEDAAGNLLVATGDEGKVYKVAADGTVSVAFDSQESQVLCLAAAADGSVYAGTGPSGLVVRLTADGKSKVVYHSPENYVWSLAVDAKGVVYAGTGPKGRIYKITPHGHASLLYTTKQDHVLSLALADSGVLYAGTDRNGVIYRIDATGKGFVLFQAPQAEVRSLVASGDGLYAGTCAPTKRKLPSSSGGDKTAGSGPPATLTSATKSASKTAETLKEPIGSSSASREKEPEKASAATAPSAPSSGENSVYRIAADGTVREVFREKVMVLGLLPQKGRLYIGTGMEGQLFEVNEATKEKSEIARLDHGVVQCLCRRRDGSIVLGTGDPGKLYVLEDSYAVKGTVLSEVFDAKLISKWGALRWKAETPAGTHVTLAVRAGNVAEPDDTWSDWSTEQTDAEQASAVCPTARFVQYRVTLTSDDPARTPVVRGVSIRYGTGNQAPEVGPIEVPDLDGGNLDSPKKLKFKWTATDANEDELTYSVHVRKEGWKNWVQLEDALTKTEYEWDTTTTPPGLYQFKVIASDRRDNAADEALEGERVSLPFPIAHVPPTVTVKVIGVEGDEAIVEATASDPLVRLASAQFAVNGKKWINVFPKDGLFDSKTETFRFKTESLKPGTHVLVLKVKDAAGNIGSGDVVFTVHEKSKDAKKAADKTEKTNEMFPKGLLDGIQIGPF
jgi:hypothetical protein